MTFGPNRRSGGLLSSRWMVALSILATLAILATSAVMVLDMRRQVELRADETSRDMLRMIERDIARNVELLDLSLQAVADGMARPDIMRLDPALRQLVLFDRSATASGLGALVAFDETGVIVADAVGPVPRQIEPVIDREYFKALRDSDQGLFISRPYRSRLLDRDVIGLARRITRADGSFGGVALATIELSFLRGLISTPQLGNESTISLVREDGVVIARRSTAAKKPAENVAHSAAFRRIVSQPSGQFVGTSAIDGVQRLYTFSRVGTTPLILTVALSTDEIYAQWSEKAVWIAAVLFAATSVIVALTILLARQLGERACAEDRLTIANAELAHLSLTDALTGLGNRRRFEEALRREARRARGSGAPASLVLVDLDQFKPLNDRLGHQQGDQTLQAVARVLAESCEAIGAFAFRVGGEEFGLLLPGLGDAAALAFADSVRGRIMALGRLNPASPNGLVTASFGVAEIGADDPPIAYGRADAALYQAKREGRNRCAVVKCLVVAA